MSAQFSIKKADSEVIACLERELGLPRFVAATLVTRGIDTPAAAHRFLNPSLDCDWLDPYIIPGLSEVADALEAAIKRDDHILVFGDFDLDGISATTVLTRGLRELGAQATPFIPRRFDEGYALSEAAFMRACSFGPDFIVTVDCGIACKAEAAMVVEAGLGLAITDHHEPSDLVPEGVPVADPKCDSACASAILAGVGVALKLVQVLGGRFGRPHLWRDYTDFATLGTVADLMPMRGENRALVADGVARMTDAPRPCIAALLGASGAADKKLSTISLSFSIIPRLNAAGRMGDAQLALDLLMTDDFDEACRLAAQLEEVNDQRRAIEAELSETAKACAAEIYHGQRALVVSGEGWHEGVKGIVASRLTNVYGVPSLLFTIDGDEARGSGRSVGQINLFKAVESMSDILSRFGGHGAAVGLTLPAAALPEFERRLCAYMDKLPEEAFHPLIEIDTCVSLDELTLENVAQLDALAPFGQEHPVPVYLARDVMLADSRAVGVEKNHFSCSLTDGRSSVSGIMFHCANIDELMTADGVLNAAFEVQIDEWRGRKSVKVMLKSLAPTHACRGLEACLDPRNVEFVEDLYEANSQNTDRQKFSEKKRLANDSAQCDVDADECRARWKQKAIEDKEKFKQAVVQAVIGDKALHEAQRDILKRLDEGLSTLGVMATGRGKSLVFLVHAAVRALSCGEASLFVYPLRALIADQAFLLRKVMDNFGVKVCVLTGESSSSERQEVLDSLEKGSCDIVLTTPEFLMWHADELAQSHRIRFVVIDEAHHVGQAKAGQRVAYATIGASVAKLQARSVLMVTATASDEAVVALKHELPLNACVLDATNRPNLVLNDQRNLRNREDYLVNLVASGEKTIVYVNSREQSVTVARMLRKRVPHLALLIGFYNAGLSRSERNRVEDLFRLGELSVLVATSAFGEGIDIPNIRHVVLYHLPFSETEFNQMSGRAGRDGGSACVHVLFGRDDCSINENILRAMAPDHDCMAQIYRKLRSLQKETEQTFFELNADELAAAASSDSFPVSSVSAACGLEVFRELGLIEVRVSSAEDNNTYAIHVNSSPSKVELTDSVRYREGLDEREAFQAFKDWVMKVDSASLQTRVSRPILPDAALSLIDDVCRVGGSVSRMYGQED